MAIKQLPNAAIDAEEAAGIMGVHYTQPGERVSKGLLLHYTRQGVGRMDLTWCRKARECR